MTIEPLSGKSYQPEHCPSIEQEISVASELNTGLVAQLQRQIQQQQQRHTLLDEIISTIRSNRDLNQVYRLATHGLVQTMRASRGLLLMFKHTDPRYRQRSTEYIPQTKATVVVEAQLAAQTSAACNIEDSGWNTAVQPTFWASECYPCQQILLGQPQVCLADQAFASSANSESLLNLNQYPALLMLPLESQGLILGSLVLQHDHSRHWLTEEVAFVRLIAAQLSTAIIQARSFQQVQSVVHERTAQLQRSLEVQAKLYEKTRHQVEQLHRLNAEREEFLSTISHELLTPLTSMTLAIRMLRQTDIDSTRRQKYLDILEHQCAQETHLINDLLALRKLERVPSSVQLQKLDLRQFIQDLLQSIEADWKEKDLKLRLNLSPQSTVYSDSDSLHRILLELLTNAKKYADSGSTVDLSVEHQGNLTAQQVKLTVCNTGAGIAADEIPHIFDKFRRGQGVTKQAISGTGLGLALVKRLVEHLDGTITAASHPLANSSSWETSFAITLPQGSSRQIYANA